MNIEIAYASNWREISEGLKPYSLCDIILLRVSKQYFLIHETFTLKLAFNSSTDSGAPTLTLVATILALYHKINCN